MVSINFISLVIFLSYFLDASTVESVTEIKFYKGQLCHLDERISNNCSTALGEITTLQKCVIECHQNKFCIGASFGEGASNSSNPAKCFLHFACGSVDSQGCSPKEPNHKYLSKHCAHGGLWDPVASKCSCVSSWVGETCLQLPSSANEFLSNGYNNGFYRFYILGGVSNINTPIPVITAANPTYAVLFIVINTGGIDFNRTWDDYKKGFFVDRDNFWVGLENWHQLSKAGHNTLYMVAFEGGNHMYRKYHKFKLLDESHGFAFNFTGWTNWGSFGNAKSYSNNIFGDCLTPINSLPFSVPVGGHHMSNCSTVSGNGWWFSVDCKVECNFLGKLPESWTDSTPYEQKMHISGINPDYFERYKSTAQVAMYIVVDSY